ncbi:tubulin-specific chaperone A isoform X4 [Rattus norvegicus]|uniref:tubulin-specific chaperone A isoform X4 n=1 Tax=Rattus norvegicus TaxID=10116 RepID=UPI0019170C3D|nr:tubulin-specific chaperone A isoform X2 [Rattus norvegicus]
MRTPSTPRPLHRLFCAGAPYSPASPSCGALGTMADPRVRQIKIKTGVVKRLVKEKVMYEKEAKQQEEKIEKMKAEDGENYAIKKQMKSQKLDIEFHSWSRNYSKRMLGKRKSVFFNGLILGRDPARVPDDDPRLPAPVRGCLH